jgi:hypothetical protein
MFLNKSGHLLFARSWISARDGQGVAVFWEEGNSDASTLARDQKSKPR